MMPVPSPEHYESEYWSPNDGRFHYVKCRFIEEASHSFREGEKQKMTMLFNVYAVDGVDLPEPKKWRSASRDLCEQIIPIIEKANRERAEHLLLRMKYTHGQGYVIIDMREADPTL